MSLLSMEGWDEFAAYPSTNGIWSLSGSRGGNGAYVHANYSPGMPGLYGASWPDADRHNTIICGAALYQPTSPASYLSYSYSPPPYPEIGVWLFQMMHPTDHNNDIWVGWAYGTIKVFRGASATAYYNTLLGTSDYVWPPGTWKFCEVKFIADASAGRVIVKLNGTVVLDLTGLALGTEPWSSVMGYASAYINYYGYPQVASGCTIVDDFYVLNGAGSVMNDFIGDVRIMALWQQGNGALSDFVGSDGNSTDNYLLTRWDHPGGSYVQAATVGATDTYDFQPIEELFAGSAPTIDPATTSVLGVSVSGQAIKTDSVATKKVAAVARQAGGTIAEGSQATIETTTSYVTGLFERKPDGSPWTLADLNAAEFGLRIKQ